jgi:hypothetical protein
MIVNLPKEKQLFYTGDGSNGRVRGSTRTEIIQRRFKNIVYDVRSPLGIW